MKKVVAAIIKQNGKLLIAKRKAGGVVGGKWEFPGGKLKSNESLEEGLKRELREELDVEVKIGDFFHEHTFYYDNEKVEFFAYTAECTDDKFNLSEHDEIRWISNKELRQFDFVGNDKLLVDRLFYC